MTILTLTVFTKISSSQEQAIAYYSVPFTPYTETVSYEPMPAIATAPIAAPEMDVAVAAMDYDSHTYTPTYTRTYYYRVPHDVTYALNPNDNVIRDFRYYGITTSGGSTQKNNHVIRDFRRELW